MKLGKLSKIDLRDQWKHEALDFTQWLAEPENLDLLGDEIGLDLKLIQTEAGVGKFSADILAEDETSTQKVVIENQLETTDHSHLGQILTYAAGIEAEYIIWIVKDARDEHKQAVEWLNAHTDEKINFFLVQIELWKIGTSDPAPKFVIISRPNDWAKSVKAASNESSELSETRLFQLEFWQQLRDFAATSKSKLKLRTPAAKHWYDISIGRSDCHVGLVAFASDNSISCELYIPNAKELYKVLESNKSTIETEIGLGELLWQELPERKASRIRIYHDFDFQNVDRTDAFQWLLSTATKFKTTFSKSWSKPSAG